MKVLGARLIAHKLFEIEVAIAREQAKSIDWSKVGKPEPPPDEI